MLTIVRKSDGKPCGTIPSNMTGEQEILLNVIPNFGGVPEDYEVQDIDPTPIEPLPLEPTYEEYLLDLDFRLSLIELGL